MAYHMTAGIRVPITTAQLSHVMKRCMSHIQGALLLDQQAYRLVGENGV